jgi:hypothetical protein
MIRVSSRGGGKYFFLLYNIHTSSGAHLATYAMGTWGRNGWGVKLTTQPWLVPRFRISGAIPLHPLYAFTAWKEKTLTVTLTRCSVFSLLSYARKMALLDSINLLIFGDEHESCRS